MTTTPLLTLQIRTEQDVVAARQRSRQIAALLNFDAQDQTRIATAVSEIARNAFRYAGGGRVDFIVDDGLEIRIADKGDGIPNLERIRSGQYRSATGMGLGIVGAEKLMDAFHIETASGKGTTVSMRKSAGRRAPKLSSAELSRITGELTRVTETPYEEIDKQSRELLQTLTDLRARQEELAQLNRELEDTNRGVVALYAELDEKAEHLRQADRLKSTFLSHMSHEFRTPLNSIMALSKILIDRLDGPLLPEQEKQVKFIHNAAGELTDMVNDLLDLAKVEAGKIEIHVAEFDVATLVGALRGMMRPLNMNANVQLNIEDPEAEMPPMFTDEAKVSQILRNFVSNALKFTERGEVRLHSSYDRMTGSVVFTVSDTGIGIAPEEQEQIFQQYYQIDSLRQRKVKGTGLGLPLSRKLAELLGGTISVRSAPGVGSQFTVRLPVRYGSSDGPAEPVRTVESLGHAMPSGDHNKPQVLVIDDEDVARYLIRKQLAPLAVDLMEARSGAEGLQIAARGGISAIVLDIVMPESSGFQILADLKEHSSTRDIPVVIHTSLNLSNEEREALTHAIAIVPKSTSESQLRDVVTSLIESRLQQH
jgi:signal transduction histidine kinase/CheY-like chemotaxis protein